MASHDLGLRKKSPRCSSPERYSSYDIIKINPYNPNNFLASKEEIEEILRK